MMYYKQTGNVHVHPENVHVDPVHSKVLPIQPDGATVGDPDCSQLPKLGTRCSQHESKQHTYTSIAPVARPSWAVLASGHMRYCISRDVCALQAAHVPLSEHPNVSNHSLIQLARNHHLHVILTFVLSSAQSLSSATLWAYRRMHVAACFGTSDQQATYTNRHARA